MAVIVRQEASDVAYPAPAGVLSVPDLDFDATLPCRIERAIRRRLLRQRGADSVLLRRLYGLLAPEDGLGRMTLRTPSGNRPLHYRPGTSDKAVIEQIFCTWDYDFSRFSRWPELRAFLADRQRAGQRPLVIDAGANIGASAAYFATAFPTARVVALEPEDANFELLVKNTAGLDVSNMKAALASEPGRANVYNPGTEHWSFRTERTDTAEGVPCVTVNALYDEFVGREVFPFIVKIDIEGGEEDVFSRNTEWVQKTPVVIIELHDRKWSKQGSSHPFLRCISALDRDFLYAGENIFSIDNALPAT